MRTPVVHYRFTFSEAHCGVSLVRRFSSIKIGSVTCKRCLASQGVQRRQKEQPKDEWDYLVFVNDMLLGVYKTPEKAIARLERYKKDATFDTTEWRQHPSTDTRFPRWANNQSIARLEVQKWIRL